MTNNEANKSREIICSRLSIARNRAGLSQSQVAVKLNLPRPSISEIEAGRRRVSAEELIKFAELYSVDLEWLAGKDTNQVDPIRDELYLAARNAKGLNDEDLEKIIGLLTSLTSKGAK
jgi:ribosome-binding protein aMBF1 (putative translation factor)